MYLKGNYSKPVVVRDLKGAICISRPTFCAPSLFPITIEKLEKSGDPLNLRPGVPVYRLQVFGGERWGGGEKGFEEGLFLTERNDVCYFGTT